MYNIVITMVTGKVFRFETNDESTLNEYEFRHEHNQLFSIPTDNGLIYINPMQIAYAEFKKINE